MSLFSRLKEKITHRRDEDFYDFRSHVLGAPPAPAAPEPQMPEPLEPLPRFGQEPDFSEPVIPRSRLKDLTVEPPAYERGFERPFERGEPGERAGRDYDMLDRLSIIEAQLQAIRSQTETINERLKNMEMRLGTRRI